MAKARDRKKVIGWIRACRAEYGKHGPAHGELLSCVYEKAAEKTGRVPHGMDKQIRTSVHRSFMAKRGGRLLGRRAGGTGPGTLR